MYVRLIPLKIAFFFKNLNNFFHKVQKNIYFILGSGHRQLYRMRIDFFLFCSFIKLVCNNNMPFFCCAHTFHFGILFNNNFQCENANYYSARIIFLLSTAVLQHHTCTKIKSGICHYE